MSYYEFHGYGAIEQNPAPMTTAAFVPSAAIDAAIARVTARTAPPAPNGGMRMIPAEAPGAGSPTGQTTLPSGGGGGGEEAPVDSYASYCYSMGGQYVPTGGLDYCQFPDGRMYGPTGELVSAGAPIAAGGIGGALPILAAAAAAFFFLR